MLSARTLQFPRTALNAPSGLTLNVQIHPLHTDAFPCVCCMSIKYYIINVQGCPSGDFTQHICLPFESLNLSAIQTSLQDMPPSSVALCPQLLSLTHWYHSQVLSRVLLQQRTALRRAFPPVARRSAMPTPARESLALHIGSLSLKESLQPYCSSHPRTLSPSTGL